MDYFLEPLTTSVFIERDESPFVFRENDLAKAYSQIEKRQYSRAKKILSNSNNSAEQLDRFIEAITNPRLRLSLMAFLHRNRTDLSRTQGFSAIVSDQDIWLFKPENENYNFVCVKSISKIDLEDSICSFLPRLEAIP
jgi:hypothetical protein